MTAELFVVIVVAGWLVTGVTTALIMGRRGHDLFAWAVLGAIFGPLSIVLALDARRSEGSIPHVMIAGSPGPGPIDVLVGLDGSAEAEHAAERASTLFGRRLGRLTLATVVDHGSWERASEHEHLAAPLRRAREIVGRRAEGIVLTGEPAAELARLAREGEYTLLVVGPRGRGLTKRVLGSVAVRLTSDGDHPVLVVPPPRSVVTSTGTAGAGSVPAAGSRRRRIAG